MKLLKSDSDAFSNLLEIHGIIFHRIRSLDGNKIG